MNFDILSKNVYGGISVEFSRIPCRSCNSFAKLRYALGEPKTELQNRIIRKQGSENRSSFLSIISIEDHIT